MKFKIIYLFSFLFFFFSGIQHVKCQDFYAPDELTVEDYQKAENALYNNTEKLIVGHDVTVQSINDDRFWFRVSTQKGIKYFEVNAKTKKKKPLFDQVALAKALSKYTGAKIDPNNLDFYDIDKDEKAGKIIFSHRNHSLIFDVSNSTIQRRSNAKRPLPFSNTSPDGKKAVFIKDHNLWVHHIKSGEQKQLTFDGIEDYGYATNNAGWVKSRFPVVSWSPDSKKVATFQHDGRGVGEMHLTSINVGHPELHSWKYPLPGDSLIFRISRVVVNVETGETVRFDMPADPHRSSTTDHIASRSGDFLDVEWSKSSDQVSFLSNSRDHKEAILRVADAETGKVRTVLNEKVETFFESGYRMANWHVLNESEEVIWYSQRSNWGHLYMYDLNTSGLMYPLTMGEWNVIQVLHVDQESRVVYFLGVGKEKGDPYFQYLYKINLDGSGLKLLTDQNANHEVNILSNGKYIIDKYSTPTKPPVTVLRDAEGKMLMTLAEADISKLKETAWRPPVDIKVLARDGVTALHGLMHLPTDFDKKKKYPIINYIYPGPQSGSVGSRSFSSSRRDNQSIANLGFIVVSIDAMGTPLRSKSFHEAYYGNMGDNGLPDQVSGMKQLAEQYSFIDLDRAGIYGHSGGGFASTDAILRYPDFFKVAVSGAGNHDNRNYEDDWGEKWQGLLVTNPDGTTNYDNQANQLIVENLKGKLMLAHGTADDNVPYYNTMLVVDKLIAANKDFDLVLFPNRRHGFAMEPYMMRKRWDYFVENLLGAKAPKEFEFKKPDLRP